jgi:hypothetical protein
MTLRLTFLAFFLVQSSVTLQAPTHEASLLWQNELARLGSILKTLPSDLDKTTFLRIYSGELIDIGRLDNQTSRFYESIDFDSFSLSGFYSLFKRDSIPGTCGITSYFYIKVLQTFVNLTYRNQKGEPLDFFEFLSLIKKKKYELIVMDAASLTSSLLIPDPSVYYTYLDDDCKKLMSQAIQQTNGSLKTKLAITRNYATLMQSPCGNFENGFVDALRKHGHEEPFIYAYALRASEMVGDSDHEEVQRRIDSILNEK